MTRAQAISTRLREVLLNGQWIANTNYQDQLQQVNWQQATQKIGNLNTIAALTYHINYYLAGLLNTFKTGRLEISDKYSFDLPPIQSEEDWKTLVTDFLNNAERFADQVEQMKDNLIDQPFVDEKYGTYLRNMEGVIEHSYLRTSRWQTGAWQRFVKPLDVLLYKKTGLTPSLSIECSKQQKKLLQKFPFSTQFTLSLITYLKFALLLFDR